MLHAKSRPNHKKFSGKFYLTLQNKHHTSITKQRLNLLIITKMYIFTAYHYLTTCCPIILFIILLLFSHFHPIMSIIDPKSYLVKNTATLMIENDGNTPMTHYLIDCDERNGHSRLSHIIAKLSNAPMPVSKTDDGKMWRIDLSSKPVEPGVVTPLMVTKVYTHLELVPSHDVYLMPYSSIQYQVRIFKQGRLQKIKVPSEHYYLVVDNKELVDLEEATSTALALESEGSTKIRFVDKNVISDEDFIQPESNIHIVKPSYLSMHVFPGNSWALQRFSDYAIEIRIFDDHQHQIYPSENLDIQITSGSELVLTNSTANGTYHSIHTLSSGPSKIIARLMGTSPTLYSFEKPVKEIELVQELNIYEPLDVKPSAIVLPWTPESKPSYQVSLYAAGGTGSYLWTTNNSILTEISYNADDSSVAKIATTGEGTAFVQCMDTRSSVFLKHSMIIVSKIVELNILPSITETELGGDILLPVAVYGNLSSLLKLHLPEEEAAESDLVLFHDCSKVKFNVEIVEKTRFSYSSSDAQPNIRPKSCASLKFTCTQPGSTRVWVSYNDPTDPSSKPIKTTTVIACYKPLKPVYPPDVGVLALHTSIEIAFEGGPRPFGSRLDDHYSYLEPVKDPILTFEPIIDRYRYNKDLHVFKAHCNEYGEVTLTLNVGNQPSATLPNPASTKASVKIICAKPDSVQLRPRLKETCPLNEMASLSDTMVPISASTPTDFDLVVFDDSKRQFLNISSFSIKWTLTGQGKMSQRQIEEVNAVAGFRRVTRNFVTVYPDGNEGQDKLQVDLNQYKNQGLYRGQTLDLTANLDIQFVDHAQISPNRTILYNHRKNVVVLSILKGSGYFSVESLQGSKNANVSYVSVFGQHRINITPLSIGKFVVRLDDQCIDSTLGAPILSDVHVVSDFEFSKEALKPGRSMKYCRDVDESMFCLYLSVDKLFPPTTMAPTVVPAIVPAHPPSPPTTAAPPTIQVPSKPSVRDLSPQQTSKKPMTTNPIQAEIRETFESSTPLPKLKFEEISKPEVEVPRKTSIFFQLLSYLVLTAVTVSAIAVPYWRWLEKYKRPANPTFVTDSSFLRQSPGRGNVSFSPSNSRGPTSSTPRSRPLFTEKFSTTLSSD